MSIILKYLLATCVLIFSSYWITDFIYSDKYYWCVENCKHINNVYAYYWNDWYLALLFIGFALPIKLLTELIKVRKSFEYFFCQALWMLLVTNAIDHGIFHAEKFEANDLIGITVSIVGAYFVTYFKKYV